MNNYINDKLIENTYLFCLKRISDSEDAKDLSQDILCEALRVIKSGKSFVSFYSWYWRMARNKYADYISYKKNPAQPLECAMGIAADIIHPIDKLVKEEDVSALNYALSCLAGMRREIIIRYYLKEQSIAEIAAASVYLEPILEQMEKESLLSKPTHNQYLTNFCVFPGKVYRDAQMLACNVFHDNRFPEKVSKIMLGLQEQIKSLDFYGKDFDWEYLMWLGYVIAGVESNASDSQLGSVGMRKRNCGWCFVRSGRGICMYCRRAGGKNAVTLRAQRLDE
uniref:RNA polymerase sigma factor n=1 Tax=Acetatifactor sp. TaxID=1872090 RepID=UPI004055A821